MTDSGVAKVTLYRLSTLKNFSSFSQTVFTIQLGEFSAGEKILSYAEAINRSRVEVFNKNDKNI